MTNNEKGHLARMMAMHLETHDKAWMFMKISFPDVMPYLNLEGTPAARSWNILHEFEKRNMLGSITAHMNTVFNLNITITY